MAEPRGLRRYWLTFGALLAFFLALFEPRAKGSDFGTPGIAAPTYKPTCKCPHPGPGARPPEIALWATFSTWTVAAETLP
jgi:hypothetical protein